MSLSHRYDRAACFLPASQYYSQEHSSNLAGADVALWRKNRPAGRHATDTAVRVKMSPQYSNYVFICLP